MEVTMAMKDEIRRRMNEKTSDELLSIWRDNDQREWSAEAMQVVQDILTQRQTALPPQTPWPRLSPATATTRKSSLAKWSLVLAIVTVPVLGQESPLRLLAVPLAVVAIALGVSAIVKIRASSGALKGKGLAIAGIILAVMTGTNPVLLPLVAGARSHARVQILEKAIRESGATTYTLSPGKSIHYSGGATEADARNVGAAMLQMQLLTVGKRHDILLSKESGGFIVSLVVPSETLFNAEAKAALPRIAGLLATKVGVPVRLRVVDFQMKELGSVQSSQ
jgi:hypothetical protein